MESVGRRGRPWRTGSRRRRRRGSGRRGPSVIVAKQGEYGAALVTSEGFFSLPAYPMENVIDPTGAGDTFAGGFVGYIAAHPPSGAHPDGHTLAGAGRQAGEGQAGEELSDEMLRRAMAHGTALASFNVEEFGTERVERLTGEEIAARVDELHAITRFSGAPLRAARLSGCAKVNAVASCGVDAWTFIWLMVFLKIPIVALFLIVRWAVRQTPETSGGEDGGIGPRRQPAAPPSSATTPSGRGAPPVARASTGSPSRRAGRGARARAHGRGARTAHAALTPRDEPRHRSRTGRLPGCRIIGGGQSDSDWRKDGRRSRDSTCDDRRRQAPGAR